MKFFSTLAHPFVSAWKFLTGANGQKFADRMKEIYNQAMPLVRLIASLTPTRTDDEIIALFDMFVVPNVDWYLALPVDKRGSALLEVAVTQMQKQFPSAPIWLLKDIIGRAVTDMKVEKLGNKVDSLV